MKTLPACLALLFFFQSCSKKDPDQPAAGPPCEAAQSTIVSSTRTDGSGNEKTQAYTNGVSSMYESIGPDTLRWKSSAREIYYYCFNSSGDQYLTHLLVLNGSRPDTTVVDFWYAYDAEHRMVKKWTRNWGLAGTASNVLEDSIVLHWENGNLSHETNLLTGTRHASYSYRSDGGGRNADNHPVQASRWLYRPGSVVTLSKDYRLTDDNGVLTPEYDGKGRLTKVTSTQSGKTASTKTFRYDCR